MLTADINYVAVLVAALASMALGALWYSPLLFGKRWMELMKIDFADMKEMKKKANKMYAINFVATLVMAYVLAHFVDYTQAGTFLEGLEAGFWIWLGFIATVMLGSVLWENKPLELYFLNISYQLLNVLIMAVIVAVWV